MDHSRRRRRASTPQLRTEEKQMATEFRINGQAVNSDAPTATPLLWVIREQLKLTGTKFGCGAGLCGACMDRVKKALS